MLLEKKKERWFIDCVRYIELHVLAFSGGHPAGGSLGLATVVADWVRPERVDKGWRGWATNCVGQRSLDYALTPRCGVQLCNVTRGEEGA